MDRFLVIGCDGLIGRALVKHLEGLPAVVYRTTRRACAVEGSLVLDLADFSRYPKAIDDLERLAQTGPLTVFLAAAVTGYDQCEDDPAASRRINVMNTCVLAERLIAQGAFVVFLSSNAVFTGKDGATENFISDPESEYGRQKADAEARLKVLARYAPMGAGVAIVRLAKVLSASQPLIRGWIDALRRGERIEAATDLLISPVSLQYAVRGLVRIGARREAGTFHISGAGSVTYFDFASALARGLAAPEKQVRPIAFRLRTMEVSPPKVGSLDMAATIARIGIHPQSMEDAIQDLLAA